MLKKGPSIAGLVTDRRLDIYMSENKEALKMDRKKFLGSLALMGAGFVAFRGVFSLFGSNKTKNEEKKITVKENPYSIKRNSTGGVNERA